MKKAKDLRSGLQPRWWNGFSSRKLQRTSLDRDARIERKWATLYDVAGAVDL
jgi:hypothetical protein